MRSHWSVLGRKWHDLIDIYLRSLGLQGGEWVVREQ